jgi:hypothetical protein
MASACSGASVRIGPSAHIEQHDRSRLNLRQRADWLLCRFHSPLAGSADDKHGWSFNTRGVEEDFRHLQLVRSSNHLHFLQLTRASVRPKL